MSWNDELDEIASNCNKLLLEEDGSTNDAPTDDDDDDDEEEEEQEEEEDEEQEDNVVVSVAKYSVAVTHLALTFLNFPRGSRARCAVAIWRAVFFCPGYE